MTSPKLLVQSTPEDEKIQINLALPSGIATFADWWWDGLPRITRGVRKVRTEKGTLLRKAQIGVIL